MKIYRLTNRQIYLYLFEQSLFPILIFWILVYSKSSELYGLFFIFIVSVFFFAMYSVSATQILTSEKVLQYFRPGLKFEVEWDNFESIGIHWFQEGLFVDKSKIRIKTWSLGTIETYAGFGQKVFVPVSRFAENWRESELGQQIKQYAPHLFA